MNQKVKVDTVFCNRCGRRSKVKNDIAKCRWCGSLAVKLEEWK